MKRILLIILAVMLVVALLVVPAFAAEGYTFMSGENGITFDRVTLPARGYVVEAIFYDPVEDDNVILTSEPFVLSVDCPDWIGYSAFADVLFQHSSGSFRVEFDLYEYGDLGYVDVAISNGSELVSSFEVVSLTFVPYQFTTTDSLFTVFARLGEWLGSQLAVLVALFWTAETGLTFIGTLGVAGLGIGVVILVIVIVARFLRFRG